MWTVSRGMHVKKNHHYLKQVKKKKVTATSRFIYMSRKTQLVTEIKTQFQPQLFTVHVIEIIRSHQSGEYNLAWGVTWNQGLFCSVISGSFPSNQDLNPLGQ